MCPKKNTRNKKHKIPSTSVTAAKLNKSTQKSSIKTFLRKDFTSIDGNWNADVCGKYGNSSQHSHFISHAHSNPVSSNQASFMYFPTF